MHTAETQGIRVAAEATYVAVESDPAAGRFFFAYRIRIENVGDRPARLVSRHWVITDEVGHVEHVRGPGVVGETPRLEPGEAFEYTSFCPLATSSGSMRGTYQMVRDDGARFDAEIPRFTLLATFLQN